MPIISLSLDNDYLWDDEIGIYTGEDKEIPNYRYNWRRPVIVEYFPNQDTLKALNQLGELRIQGNTSRINPLKSMNIYSNKRFGTKLFSYPFFKTEDKKDVLIKSFILRNAGNDYGELYLMDGFLQTLAGTCIDIDYQAYQPAIVFVNGEYWGIMNIRERSNEDNIYGNYNGLENVDVVENWNQLKTGDWVDFDFLKYGLRNKDFSCEDIKELVDIHEWMNILVYRAFLHDIDFLDNNIVVWKEKVPGAKWRAIMKDVDRGFGGAEINAIEDYLQQEWYGGDLFRLLLSCPEHRSDFLNYYTVYMGDIFSEERVYHVMDSIKSNIEIELPYHLQQIKTHTPESYMIMYNYWKTVRIGPSYQHNYQQLNDYYGFKGIIPFTIDKIEGANRKSIVEMNGIGLQTNRYNGMYYKGEKFKLKWTEDPASFTAWNIKLHYASKSSTTLVLGDIEMEYTLPEDIESVEIEIVHSLKNPDIIGDDDEEPVIISRYNNGISISGLKDESDIRIFDISGKKLNQFKTQMNSISMDLYEKGIYILKISTGNKTKSYKVIY